MEDKEDVRMSPAVSSAMDVGNIPWTFLHDRSPVQRQPVWGAFWGEVGTPAPTTSLHPPYHPHPEDTDKQSVLQARTVSSSSLFGVPAADDIDVIDDDNSDESVGSCVKSAGGGEDKGEGKTPATQIQQGGGGEKETNQNQNGVFSGTDPSMENLDRAPFSSAMEKNHSEASLTSNSYVYSDFVHFAQHNCHHYSAFETIDPRADKLHAKHYPIKGGNGFSHRGAVKNHTCACLCHSRKTFHNDETGLVATDLTDIGKSVSQTADGELTTHTQKGCAPSKSTPDLRRVNSLLKVKNARTTPCGKAESLPDVKVAPHSATSLERCQQESSVCILDLENNNKFSVAFRHQTDSSSQFSEQLDNEMSDDVFSDDPSPKLSCKAACSRINENESEGDESLTKDGEENGGSISRGASSNDVQVGVDSLDSKRDVSAKVCKLCGCFLDSSNTREQLTSVAGVTSSQQEGTNGSSAQMTSLKIGASQDVPSLLSGDSILLRADELNAPAYLQRYLVEAQKHFLQQQQDLYRQSGHDPPPPANPPPSSSSLPTADSAAVPIPPELLKFLVREEDFVPESILANGEAVSVVEELRSEKTKTSCWGKKSFKSTSSGNSKTSKTNSRQSSRNSRGKHSSIEDLDAEDDEGWLEGLGSLWGGSSSNCSNSIVDRNDNLKKKGLSIIHVEGTSTDPGFEMIVPYEGAEDEEESTYSSRRRRQRHEERLGYSTWKGETVPLRQRLLKAGLCALIFGVILGIFIGVVIHFSKDAKTDDSASIDPSLISHGGFVGFKR